MGLVDSVGFTCGLIVGFALGWLVWLFSLMFGWIGFGLMLCWGLEFVLVVCYCVLGYCASCLLDCGLIPIELGWLR